MLNRYRLLTLKINLLTSLKLDNKINKILNRKINLNLIKNQ
jgi:hypothetical protein